MSDRKPLALCQRNLLLLWTIGSVPAVMVMFLQSLHDY